MFCRRANILLMSEAGSDDTFISHPQTTSDIQPHRLQQAPAQDHTGIADRCSYVRATRTFPLSISVYRSRVAGPFSPRERNRIVTMMPILVAAVDRHAQWRRAPPSTSWSGGCAGAVRR